MDESVEVAQKCARIECDKPAAEAQKYCSKECAPYGLLEDKMPRQNNIKSISDNDGLVTAGVLAKALGRHQSVVHFWVKAGKIKPCRHDPKNGWALFDLEECKERLANSAKNAHAPIDRVRRITKSTISVDHNESFAASKRYAARRATEAYRDTIVGAAETAERQGEPQLCLMFYRDFVQTEKKLYELSGDRQ